MDSKVILTKLLLLPAQAKGAVIKTLLFTWQIKGYWYNNTYKDNSIPADWTTWKAQNKSVRKSPRHVNRLSIASSALPTRFMLVVFHGLPFTLCEIRVRPKDVGPCTWPSVGQETSSHLCMWRWISIKKLLLKTILPLAKNTALKLHPATELWHAAGSCSNILPCYSHTCHKTQLPCCFTDLSSSHDFWNKFLTRE